MKFATIGATGNAALRQALAAARADGLTPSIYCHPVGYHGHAAGPPIGMTDYQDGVPVRGEYVFRPDTWHSIELNVQHQVPEWKNQRVRFALEEDAALLSTGACCRHPALPNHPSASPHNASAKSTRSGVRWRPRPMTACAPTGPPTSELASRTRPSVRVGRMRASSTR